MTLINDASPTASPNPLIRFLSILWSGPAWKRVAFLALSFPLGLAWFVFLTTGLSLGLGLAITIAGLPLLALMTCAWRALASLERWQAVQLLGVTIAPSPVLTASSVPGVWARLVAVLRDSLTWRGLGYLVLRFPMGIAAFVTVVTLGSLSAALLVTPFTYPEATVQFGSWRVDTLPGALACFAVGLLLVPVSLHLLNAMGRGWGVVARWFLSPASATGGRAPGREVNAQPTGPTQGSGEVLSTSALLVIG